jgi:hypothetical protein
LIGRYDVLDVDMSPQSHLPRRPTQQSSVQNDLGVVTSKPASQKIKAATKAKSKASKTHTESESKQDTAKGIRRQSSGMFPAVFSTHVPTTQNHHSSSVDDLYSQYPEPAYQGSLQMPASHPDLDRLRRKARDVQATGITVKRLRSQPNAVQPSPWPKNAYFQDQQQDLIAQPSPWPIGAFSQSQDNQQPGFSEFKYQQDPNEGPISWRSTFSGSKAVPEVTMTNATEPMDFALTSRNLAAAPSITQRLLKQPSFFAPNTVDSLSTPSKYLALQPPPTTTQLPASLRPAYSTPADQPKPAPSTASNTPACVFSKSFTDAFF